MATSIGWVSSIVINCVASEALTKGWSVSLDLGATIANHPKENTLDDPVILVEKHDANAKFFGIAMTAAAVNDSVGICVFGLCDAVTGADIALGEVVTADTDGSMKDCVVGTDPEHGVAVEAGSASGTTKIIVNAIAGNDDPVTAVRTGGGFGGA